MAIYAPGHRDRKGKKGSSLKRKTTVALSLTAMVDMFTVLTIFLIQNYKTTGEVLHIHKEVSLPTATETKDLTPAHVVTISKKIILLDEKEVGDYTRVKEQKGWMVSSLYHSLQDAIREDEVEYRKKLKTRVRSVVYGKDDKAKKEKEKNFRKITVEADKDIDFLTIKKVMFTVTEAGAEEINFAVITRSRKQFEDEFGVAPTETK